MSALITASDSRISEEEKVETLLASLPPEFDAEIPFCANLLETIPSLAMEVLFVVVVPWLEAVGEGSGIGFNARSADSSGISLRAAPNQEFGGISHSFGLHAPTLPNGSVSNCVELSVPPEYSRNLRGPSDDVAGSFVPWRTKPRARVYSGSNPYIGLPRIPDLHISDVSESTRSHINATQYGSNCDGTDSYILIPVGTTSW
ncbi:hypothetical protein PVK06_023493 [Gossypium arboreum]|uniref:Uncharacterized protein n=1 Tax=Gossypium arboreum TaxID=29729 RepID=A0ABR0PBF5_GOSAR|nr:hypothetical protein PVK06_023493 [Gossypium arboreum]